MLLSFSLSRARKASTSSFTIREMMEPWSTASSLRVNRPLALRAGDEGLDGSFIFPGYIHTYMMSWSMARGATFMVYS